MSSYYQEQSEPDDMEKTLFEYQSSISNSVPTINSWKQDMNLQGLQYLRREYPVIKKTSNLILSVNRIRAICFGSCINEEFKKIVKSYTEAFKTYSSESEQLHGTLNQNDKKIKQLLHYLCTVQGNDANVYFRQLCEEQHKTIYSNLKKIIAFCVNRQIIWSILFTVIHYKDEDQAQQIQSTSLSGYQSYYEKEIKHILRGKPQLKQLFKPTKNLNDLLFNVRQIMNNKNIGENTKLKYTTLIKGQYYLWQSEKEQQLKDSYVRKSLQMYYGRFNTQIWRQEQYQSSCLQIIKESMKNPQYIPYFFTIEPDEIKFGKHKKIKQFLIYFNEILNAIISLRQNSTKTFQFVSKQFMETLLDDYYFPVFIHMIISFYNSIKGIYSMKDRQVHELFIKGIQKIQSLYLSFEGDVWICPISVFMAIDEKFFAKHSDSLKEYIQNLLPKMVEKMCNNKMPTQMIMKDGQVRETKITKLQYLQIFLNYVEDVKANNQVYIHFNFSNFSPQDLQTSVLFVKVLQLKYNYHEPNDDEKNSYSLMLDDCIKYYKINTNFSWYKKSLQTEDRQIQFIIHRQIKVDWINKIIQKCLNERDVNKNDRIVNSYNNGQITLINGMHALKYSFGVDISPSRYSIREQQIFELLQQMKIILSMHYENIFRLCIQEQISINNLHLYLLLYNVKFQEAKGSQIYFEITNKIVKPFFMAKIEDSQQFKERYYQFFMPFIVGQYMPLLGQTLIDHVIQYCNNEEYRQGILNKIRYFISICEDYNTTADHISQFLLRLVSIFNAQMHPEIFIALVELYSLFIFKMPQLKEMFGIQSIIDEQLILNKERFHNVLKIMHKKRKEYIKPVFISIIQLVVRLHNENKVQFQLQQWGILIKTSHLIYQYEPAILLPLLIKNLKDIKKESEPIVNIAYAIATYNFKKVDSSQANIKNSSEAWKNIEKNIKDYEVFKQQKKEKDKQIKNITEIFGLQFLQELKTDCKGSSEENAQTKVWKKVIWKIGSLHDILQYGALQNILLQSKDKQKQFLVQLILLRECKDEIWQKGTSKLPFLRDCAIQVVKILQKEDRVVAPEHIAKLIMINNKFSSAQVQKFIIKSISKFDGLINIRVHQKYLVNDIKKELSNFSSQSIQKYLQNKESVNIEKINYVFRKILCLPLQKFESISLKNNIEHIDENNEEWQTQSQNEQEEQETKVEKKPLQQKKIARISAPVSPFQMENSQKQQPQYQQSDIQLEVGKNKIKEQNADIDNESSFDDVSEDCSLISDDDDDDDQDCEDDYDRPRIIQIFYEEGDQQNLKKYKEYVNVREQINIIVNDNYTALEQYKSEQFDTKLMQIVKIIESIENQEIVKSLLRKMPVNLYTQLQRLGLTKEQNLEQQKQLREQEKGKPKFDDNDNNSEDNVQENYTLDDESNSDQDNDDDWAGDDDSMQEEKIIQNLCEESQEIPQMDIPQNLHKEMSHIEEELTGNELTKEEVIKILQISIFQLFLISSSQAKLQAFRNFYVSILKSKMRKIFVDSVLVLIRIEEALQRSSQYQNILLNYHKIGLSPRRALDSLLYFISESYSDEEDSFYKELANEGGNLLPTAQNILTQGITVQDNILTLLILYSKIKHPKTYRKLFQILRKTSQNNYKLTKKNGRLLTMQVFKNENESGFWKKVDMDFNIRMDKMTKFYCCLSVFGKQLTKQLTEVIIENQKVEESKNLSFQVKVAENLLKLHQKKLKHFFYWNKSLINDLDQDEKKKSKLVNLLKNKQFISLVELMFFYLKFLKQKFFSKIQEKKFNKMISLPKSIVQIAFIYIKAFSPGIQKWQTRSQVGKFFNTYQYGKFTFKKIEEVCNLILQLLQIPCFSVAIFKNIIIPYFIKNPEGVFEIPFIFKAPNIPEQQDGQRLFVTRQCSFDMSLYQLNSSSILVQYNGQQGSDYGGMVRELMMGWQGQGIGQQYCFLGKILAISFKKGIPYGGTLDIAMAMAITNYTPSLDFIKEMDPNLYKNLQFIVENDVQDLDIYFVINKEKYGVLKQYPLKENGEKILVNNENKNQYINLYLQNYYKRGRQWQLDQLKVGFYSIVNKKYASIFHPLELIQKVRGEEVDDYVKLKKKTQYEEGYTESSPIIKWLWEIISTFDQKQMNKFIQFVTGAPKISIYDPHFKFIIEKTYGSEQKKKLPVAHTCFNTIDLPQYPTKQVLQKKLRQAIFEGNDNFGLL